MDWSLIIPIAVVIILGSALQSAAGFGFGMFAIPLLILLGAQSFEAITIIAICGTVQTVIGIYHLRKHVHWRQMAGMIAMSGAALPVGVWVLSRITLLDPEYIRQVFGLVVLTALIVQWSWKIKPREKLHWSWCVLACVLAGFMAGMSGMGGPPVVMWIMAHHWSNQRSRVTLWTLFLGLTPLQLFFLHQKFGPEVITAIGEAFVVAPFVLLGILPGLWLGHRISKPHLRQISYLIILVISLYAIIQPYAARQWNKDSSATTPPSSEVSPTVP